MWSVLLGTVFSLWQRWTVVVRRKSWRGGGTARRSRGTVHLQAAPPGPVHQMSDELVDDETKSLSVTHDSQGVVPVIYGFTCSLKCIHERFLVFSGFNLRNLSLRCFQVAEHAVLIGRTRLSGGSTEKNSVFFNSWPNSCTHPLIRWNVQKDRWLRWESISFQRKLFAFATASW